MRKLSLVVGAANGVVSLVERNSAGGDGRVFLAARNEPGLRSVATSIGDSAVDNMRPVVDVEITSGTGNCGKFGIGDVLSGTFSMDEIHSAYLTLSVTPLPEAAGGTMRIQSAVPAAAAFAPPVSGANATATLIYAGLTFDTNGVTAGTWELDTAGMEPCGYNIRIYADDRTIVNSGFTGWAGSDIEGFCLE